jgi:hypothetical protein
MSGALGAFPIGFPVPPSGAQSLPATRVPISSAYSITNDDKGKWLRVTSAVTLTYPAAASLDSDFFCYIENASSGAVDIARTGTTTIDGLTSYKMYQGEVRRADKASETTITTKVLVPFYRTITATELMTRPPGYTFLLGFLWGSGGSGSKSGGANVAGGGGGGACVQFLLPLSALAATFQVTIGAAVTGPSGTSNGTAGGDSQIALASGGNISASGGGRGTQGASPSGGGGGGWLSGPSGALFTTGGEPRTGAVGHFGGGDGSTTGAGNPSAYGGGGGGGGNGSGGQSVYGGGGGGAGATAATNSGGSSVFGGAGGDGKDTASGTNGTAPGGGGGGTRTGAKAGDGARGECRLWGIPA